MLLIVRLLRSMTRTCSVTSSAFILNMLPSSISAEFGSGVGVGFGFRIGAGGGGPNCGAMRLPGLVCRAGVGVAWGLSAVVVRGRESPGCCARLAAPKNNKKIAIAPIKAMTADRLAFKFFVKCRNLIKLVNPL